MQNSKIEWTDHTFNPWWGCQRVSPGCEHCYAEALAHRYNFRVWGPAKTTDRREMSANYWKQPLRWNKQAEKDGMRKRVFCASMADVFESHPQVTAWRSRLFDMIEQTPHLDWLLLTKRPENILDKVPYAWCEGFPRNIWIGTSVEDQRRADERIPHLLRVPARVRFLSCEPLLGAVDLSTWLPSWVPQDEELFPIHRNIHWVIAGGESGHNARPMHPDWVRSLRDQCQAVGVAFFFKQWGEYTPYYEAVEDGYIVQREYQKGVKRVGKHAAGRLLDGQEWSQFPQ